MKYLDTFENIEQDIRDICVDLEDSGFKITTQLSGNILFIYFYKTGDVVLYDSSDSGIVARDFSYYYFEEIEEKCEMISDYCKDEYSIYYTFNYIQPEFDGDFSIETTQTGFLKDKQEAEHHRLIYTSIELKKTNVIRKFIKRFTSAN